MFSVSVHDNSHDDIHDLCLPTHSQMLNYVHAVFNPHQECTLLPQVAHLFVIYFLQI